MIRAIEPGDADAVGRLAVAAGLASPGDEPFFTGLVQAYLSEDGADDTIWAVVDEDGVVAAVVYAQAEPATDRCWDLTMLAVAPEHQGGGHGSALMGHVERTLRGRGQRLLLVRTSSRDQFSLSRSFYAGLGYEEEARIRDRWADGDDDVTFRKRLA